MRSLGVVGFASNLCAAGLMLTSGVAHTAADAEQKVKEILRQAQADANVEHQKVTRARARHQQQDILLQHITARNAQRAERRASCKVRKPQHWRGF